MENESADWCILLKGLIIVILGVATPYIIGYANWRVIYFSTAGAGLVFWIALFFFFPETKFTRSKDEQSEFNCDL